MTACIVGWSHGKFGKLDGETSGIADREGGQRSHRPCRHRTQGHRCHLRGQHEWRLRAPGVPFLPAAAGPSRSALQALDARGERLRHRLGRDPHGPEHARRQQGAFRAGGRRREDDRAQQRAGRRGADQGLVRRRRGRHRGGLRRHLRQDHLGLFPALRRQVRRARQDRGQGAQERCQEPVRAFPEGVRLRLLPQSLRQEPVRRGPAQAHRLLAGDRRCRRRGADRRRHRARHEAGRSPSGPRSTSTTSCP